MNGYNQNNITLNGLETGNYNTLQILGNTQSILYTDTNSYVQAVSNTTNGFLKNVNKAYSFASITLSDLTNTLTANRVLINNTSQNIDVSAMSDATLNLFNSNFVLTSSTIKINYPLYGLNNSRLLYNYNTVYNSITTDMLEFGNDSTTSGITNMYKFNGINTATDLYILPGYYYSGSSWTAEAKAFSFDIPGTGIIYFSDSVSVYNNLYGSRYTNKLIIIPDIDFQNYKNEFYAQSNIQYVLMGNTSNASLNNYISLVDNAYQTYNSAGFSIYRQTTTNTTTLTNQGVGSIIFNNKTALNTGYKFQTETTDRMTLTGTLLNILVETTIPTLNLTTLNLSGTFAPSTISTTTLTATSIINSTYINDNYYMTYVDPTDKSIKQSGVYLAYNATYGYSSIYANYIRTAANVDCIGNCNITGTLSANGNFAMNSRGQTQNQLLYISSNANSRILVSGFYIDGTTGDLNLNAKSLTNVNNITATTLITAPTLTASTSLINSSYSTTQKYLLNTNTTSKAIEQSTLYIDSTTGDLNLSNKNITNINTISCNYISSTESLDIYSEYNYTIGTSWTNIRYNLVEYSYGSIVVSDTFDYLTLSTTSYYRVIFSCNVNAASADMYMSYGTCATFNGTYVQNTTCQAFHTGFTGSTCYLNVNWVLKPTNQFVKFFVKTSPSGTIKAYNLSIVRIA